MLLPIPHLLLHRLERALAGPHRAEERTETGHGRRPAEMRLDHLRKRLARLFPAGEQAIGFHVDGVVRNSFLEKLPFIF